MEEFLSLYNEIFLETGISNCGRDKCKRLIEISNSLEPEISHGNLRTGFMNVNAIKKLKSKLI